MSRKSADVSDFSVKNVRKGEHLGGTRVAQSCLFNSDYFIRDAKEAP
jgi:hypothetical protein